MAERGLRSFVRESNRIEGIAREPYPRELAAHEAFLALDEITAPDLIRLVSVLAPGKPLRQSVGMNVRVGAHLPMPGGPAVADELDGILSFANHAHGQAYKVHHQYETLHPFMDGNGRSGRALWLWMMLKSEIDPYALRRRFLHTWYYQSLASGNRSGIASEGATRPVFIPAFTVMEPKPVFPETKPHEEPNGWPEKSDG